MSPITYHVLLALGDTPKHGYAILREIDERTESMVTLLPGTLYSTIKKLLAEKWIEECAPPEDADSSDARRRYYRLSELGRRRASEETDRMAALVRRARRKGFAASR